MAYRTLVPRPGIKSVSPGLEASVLTAGPIGKSFNKNFLLSCQISLTVSRAANNISPLLTETRVKEDKVSRFNQAGPCGAFQGQTPLTSSTCLLSVENVNLLKQNWTLWSFLPMSSVCLLSWKNFSQRISLIREVRKCTKRGKESKETK